MGHSEKSTEEQVNLLQGNESTTTNVLTPPGKRRKVQYEHEQYIGATITNKNCTIININIDNVTSVEKIVAAAK